MNPRIRHRVIWFAMAFEAAVLALALFLGWVLSVPLLGQIRLRPSAVLLGVVATLPLLGALWWGAHTEWEPVARLLREIEETLVPLFRGASMLQFGVIALLAGLGEEALFRGVIQTSLGRVAGPFPGLAVASLLFGLAHFVTPTYALLAGLIGAYLGGLALAFDNLLVPIVVHALYDFVALHQLVSAIRPPPTPGRGTGE